MARRFLIAVAVMASWCRLRGAFERNAAFGIEKWEATTCKENTDTPESNCGRRHRRNAGCWDPTGAATRASARTERRNGSPRRPAIRTSGSPTSR